MVITNTFYQLLFVIITAAFFVFSNLVTFQWTKTGQNWLWIPVFLSACIGYVFFGYYVKQTNLSISSGLVDAFIVIFSILIGIFILKDVVTFKQTIGLLFAIVAVTLIL